MKKEYEDLIKNKDIRMAMGKAGRKKVERVYDWEKNVEQMISKYQNMIRK